MGSRRAIYNDIAPKPRFFFVQGQKFPRARPCPREFFGRGRKNSEVEAAISLYIARRDPIYIINIPLFCLSLQKNSLVYWYLLWSIRSFIFLSFSLKIYPVHMPYIHIYALCTGHIYEKCPPSTHIYDDIALAAEFFIFFGLCTGGILTKNNKNIQGIQVGYLYIYIYYIYIYIFRTNGRMDGLLFEDQKTMFFANILKITRYFFLLYFRLLVFGILTWMFLTMQRRVSRPKYIYIYIYNIYIYIP